MSSNPYIHLLKANKNYRNLFSALAISLLGDWLCLIAIFSAVNLYISTDTSVVAWILVLKQLPFIFMAPISGSAADRFSRKYILILADLGRAIVVLGFLLIPYYPSTWLVYGLVAIQTCLSAFFEPARTAIVPDIVEKEQILSASALGAMLWSTILAIGAGLGGPITEYFGWEFAVILDAITYLISAFFVSKICYQEKSKHQAQTNALGLNDLRELFRLFKTEKNIFALSITKGLYGIGGAMYMMLTIFGQKVYGMGETAAIGVSILYIARGFGAFCGPIVGRHLSDSNKDKMQLATVLALVSCCIFYVLFGLTHTLSLAFFWVFFAHMSGSIVWVFSTVLLQMQVPREIRGRVFGFELGLFSLTSSISTLLYSYLIDYNILPIRSACIVMALSWLLAALVAYRLSKHKN